MRLFCSARRKDKRSAVPRAFCPMSRARRARSEPGASSTLKTQKAVGEPAMKRERPCVSNAETAGNLNGKNRERVQNAVCVNTTQRVRR